MVVLVAQSIRLEKITSLTTLSSHNAQTVCIKMKKKNVYKSNMGKDDATT